MNSISFIEYCREHLPDILSDTFSLIHDRSNILINNITSPRYGKFTRNNGSEAYVINKYIILYYDNIITYYNSSDKILIKHIASSRDIINFMSQLEQKGF